MRKSMNIDISSLCYHYDNSKYANNNIDIRDCWSWSVLLWNDSLCNKFKFDGSGLFSESKIVFNKMDYKQSFLKTIFEYILNLYL